jgi:BASS family bile acid:Na+ symporter
MAMAHLIGLAISLSMGLVILGLGLHARLRDATYVLRRPGLLVRSLVSMDVAMPLFAAGVVVFFNLGPAVGLSLVALALSPVPPYVPLQAKAHGESYAIGLLVVTTVAATVIAPLGIALVGQILGKDVDVSALLITTAVVMNVLLPLGAGILIRRFAPALAIELAPWVSIAGTALLVAALLPLLLAIWPEMLVVARNGTLAALAAFTLLGITIGHNLGGPHPDHRTVLALASGTRHPGVALAIASATFPDIEGVLAVMVWHLIIGAIVSAPYVNRRHQVHANASRGGDIFARPFEHR